MYLVSFFSRHFLLKYLPTCVAVNLYIFLVLNASFSVLSVPATAIQNRESKYGFKQTKIGKRSFPVNIFI